MKKLYEVECLWYVMAENAEDARWLSLHSDDATKDVSLAVGVNSDWWDAIPVDSDDDRTCGQIIKQQREAELLAPTEQTDGK
jgi:hypothetical protein